MSSVADAKKNYEKNEKILYKLLQEEPNKFCADCGQRGTRWASWNLGVFLCIKCGGLHRKLGTHISKVKSVTLDTWTDEQIESIKEKGNEKMNALYNPKKRPAPTYSGEMEQFIRDKYETKSFMDASSRLMMKSAHSATLSASTTPSIKASAQSSSSSSSSTNSRQPSLMAVKSPSEYLPKYIHSYEESKFSSALRQLYEMGFTMPDSNLTALKASQGDLNQAIEYLIASGEVGAYQQASDALPKRDETYIKPSDLVRLKEMGFKNESLNREALAIFKGKFEEAINHIVQRSSSTSPSLDSQHGRASSQETAPGPVTKEANLFDFGDDEPTHNGSSAEQGAAKTELSELLDSVHLSSTVPVDKRSDKESILSLYATALPAQSPSMPYSSHAPIPTAMPAGAAAYRPPPPPAASNWTAGAYPPSTLPATTSTLSWSSQLAPQQTMAHSSSASIYPTATLGSHARAQGLTHTLAPSRPQADRSAVDPFASLTPLVSFQSNKNTSESASAKNGKKPSSLDLSMFDSLN